MKKQIPKVYGYFDTPRVVVHTGTDSKVQQHQADDCDMKTIINRFLKTGEITHISNQRMQFLDVTHSTDYDKSLQIVLDAQDTFFELPSNLRSRFNNDPSQFLKFMDDPNNKEEAIEMGLAQRPPQKMASKNDTGSSKNPVGDEVDDITSVAR